MDLSGAELEYETPNVNCSAARSTTAFSANTFDCGGHFYRKRRYRRRTGRGRCAGEDVLESRAPVRIRGDQGPEKPRGKAPDR
jgi:hypothetical protein